MRLTRNPFWMVANPEELPTHDALYSRRRKTLDISWLSAKTPIVEEEYRAHIFRADAATDVIAS